MVRRPRWARVIMLGVVMAAAGGLPVAAARAPRAQETPAPRLVQVEYGDSVWSLARRYGDPHQDVRSIVAGVLRANDVGAGGLQPGQRLAFPAECLPGARR